MLIFINIIIPGYMYYIRVWKVENKRKAANILCIGGNFQ